MRSAAKALAFAAIVVTLTACGSDGSDDADPIVVGAGDDPTGEVLAYIYAGAVRAAGMSAEVRPGLGQRSDYLGALDSGSVGLIADFTGDLLQTFDSTSTVTDADDVFEALNRSLPEGLSVSDFALAEDRTAIAVSSDGPLARVGSIGDVAGQCPSIVLATVPGTPSVTEVVDEKYGCAFAGTAEFPTPQEAVDAVESGAVGAVALTTASFGPLAKDLVTLDDDRDVFVAQNVVPLFRNGTFDDLQTRTLNVVAGELTTADLADMIGEVRSGASSDDVARKWLGEHNL